MPLIRKVIKHPDGTRLITLPKSWVGDVERKTGKPLKEIYMDVGEVIVVRPVVESGV
jgi:hypothetical protein